MLFQFDLFNPPAEMQPETPVPERAIPKRRLVRGWQLVDHACRQCFGRLLQHVDKSGDVAEARCAECGIRAEGTYAALCCCGADCGDLGNALECYRNPLVTAEMPHEILVRERRVSESTREVTNMRPVKLKDF